MAKKTKVMSNKACCMPGEVYSPSMYVDFDEVEEVAGLKVGDTVRVMVKGTVKSVEQRENYDDPKVVRASLGVKNFEAEIITDETDFDALLDDSDE